MSIFVKFFERLIKIPCYYFYNEGIRNRAKTTDIVAVSLFPNKLYRFYDKFRRNSKLRRTGPIQWISINLTECLD